MKLIHLVTAFCFTFLSFLYLTGLSQSPAAMKTSSIEYACGDILIKVPVEIENASVYSFENGVEKLTVAYEPMPKNIQPAAMTQSIKKRLARVLGSTAVYDDYTVESKTLSFAVLSINVNSGKFFMYHACFQQSDSLMATISYQTQAKESKAVLDQILNSVTGIHDGPAAHTGYISQFTGLNRLDVPKDLKSASYFRFTSPDDHTQLFVSLKKSDLTDYVTDNGVKADLAKTDALASSNKIVSHVEKFIATIKTHAPPEQKWFTTAQITTKNGSTYFLLLYEITSADFGKRHWADIVNSIKELN